MKKPSKAGRKGSPRKPVTIDLEAKTVDSKADADKSAKPAIAADKASGTTKSTDTSSRGSVPKSGAASQAAKPGAQNLAQAAQGKTIDPSASKDDGKADDKAGGKADLKTPADAKTATTVGSAVASGTLGKSSGDAKAATGSSKSAASNNSSDSKPSTTGGTSTTAAKSPATASTSAKSTSAPKPTSTKSGSGVAGMAVAACLGGGIALGGAWLLGAFDADPVEGFASADSVVETRTALDGEIASLREQIAALPAAAPAGDPAASDALTQRIVTIEERLAAAPDGAVAAADPELAQRIDALDARIATTGEQVTRIESAVSSGDAGEGAGLATINERVGAVDERLASFDTRIADVATSIEQVQATVGEVRDTAQGAQSATTSAAEQAAQALAAATAAQTLLPQLQTSSTDTSARLDEIVQQLTSLRSELGTEIEGVKTSISGEGGLAPTVSGVQEAVATVQTTVGDVQTTVADVQEKLASVTTTVEERAATIEQLQERVANENRLDRQAAQAVAAAALKNEIDRGTAFTPALDNLRAIAADPATLDPLTPYAATGVPTVARLEQRFDGGVADAIRTALRPAAPTEPRDRLLAGLRGLVGGGAPAPAATDGNTAPDPAAGVNTIAEALDAGDAAAADAAWQALPEAGRTASADWHKDLAARVAADRLVGDTVDTYLLGTASQ